MRYLRTLFKLSLISLLIISVVTLVWLVPYVYQQDQIVQEKFEGKRWSLPSRVYARPLELYRGKHYSMQQVVDELLLLGYQPSDAPLQPGDYRQLGEVLLVAVPPFTFWDGDEPARQVRIAFQDKQVMAIRDENSGLLMDILRFDPLQIASIYPQHNEDRLLVKLEQWPPLLSATLQAVEDRKFTQHHGIDFIGILRAVWVNLRSGRLAQGGSTLTQQLVKNFFLTNERTLKRKLNEAIMSLLLEYHYDKMEILEAYGNEIYLGQDGRRAIHGFGLASQFYFKKPIETLELHEIALLVGLLRGASYYDPRRFPERALQRRNQVLAILEQQGVITAEDMAQASDLPLSVVDERPSGVARYPAFLDLVREQLAKDYREEDLRSEGLRIFTALDPLVQHQAEQSLTTGLDQLEQQKRIEQGALQGAVVVSRIGSAEVVAVVGGRDAKYAGFNRAINAKRPVGSLIKPAVYLTALSQPALYTLATMLKDEPVTLPQPDGSSWQPRNYDHQLHGTLPLYQGLINSLNLATINLGLTVGIENVLDTLRRLGLQHSLEPYPSLFLGAVSLSPIEVTQLYQTIADEGFYTPLRVIRDVVTADNNLLQRYPIETEQRFNSSHLYLLNQTLQQVVEQGTAKGLHQYFPKGFTLAGKTGTTDDLRDSWFAGFSSDLLAVTWLGRDDNQPANLTGASGALRVWGDMMSKLPIQPLSATAPGDVRQLRIDSQTGLLATRQCEGLVELPFIIGSEPMEYAPCAGNVIERQLDKTIDWVRKAFE
jgi:penicillin-binding protein 1B